MINDVQLLKEMAVMVSGAEGQVKKTNSEDHEFGALLKNAMLDVNKSQLQADQLKVSYDLGESDVSLAQVMLAQQKSNIEFQAMIQVRNKLVSAYKEISNMQW